MAHPTSKVLSPVKQGFFFFMALSRSRKVESSVIRPAVPSQGNRSWQWQKHTQNLFGKRNIYPITRM